MSAAESAVSANDPYLATALFLPVFVGSYPNFTADFKVGLPPVLADALRSLSQEMLEKPIVLSLLIWRTH